jgi:hypothetical protein
VRTVLSIALLVVACQKEPASPPPNEQPAGEQPTVEEPKDEPAAEKVDVVGEPVTFTPLTPAAVCTYEMKEVATETLGDQLLAGHEITVTYELAAQERKEGLAFEANVTRVQTDARRETYSAKLDSLRAGDRMRVQGGADTIVMYEMVLPFAFIGKRVTLELDQRGRFRALQGGDAVRQAMLAMHPPKPRKNPHYQKRVEVALSDEAIAEYLMPSALAIPQEGPFASGRQETSDGLTFDLIEYGGRGSEGFRLSVRPERWLVEHKRTFARADGVSSAVPQLANAMATVELMGGDRSVTVEFEPTNPCFRRAASAFNDQAVWSGTIEDVKTTTDRKRSITRIWTKK